MPVVIHKDSHLDHNIPQPLLDRVLARFSGRTAGFFIETAKVDAWLPLGITGPLVGDDPVQEAEVYYCYRGGRPYPSRMLKLGSHGGYCRPRHTYTDLVTVIVGPHDGHDCVLWTAFAGPLAPREPGDPSMTDEIEIAAAKKFWSEHALVEVARVEETSVHE